MINRGKSPTKLKIAFRNLEPKLHSFLNINNSQHKGHTLGLAANSKPLQTLSQIFKYACMLQQSKHTNIYGRKIKFAKKKDGKCKNLKHRF